MAVALKQSYLRPYSPSSSPFTCSLRSFFSFMRYYSSCSLPPGPGLEDFIKEREFKDIQLSGTALMEDDHSPPPYLNEETIAGRNRKVYFETYGCQMNANDTEIAWSILSNAGYRRAKEITDADVILAVTCAIRENAENKVWNRLDYFSHLKQKRSANLPPLKVGLLGCMAERLKEKLLDTDKQVDLIAGPDAYRDLPRLLAVTESGEAAVNVALSLDETYADVSPVRLNESSPTAFVSIMRGCDNMCSFCIVPFTRGRERSRPMSSIISEVKSLSEQGIKQVTLLGQNVNSYRELSPSHSSSSLTNLSRGFSSIYKSKEGGRRFAELLHEVAQVDPDMRIRFTSPHPKDFPDELLEVIRENGNICKHIHLPIQSGSTRILQLMRRGHTREAYLSLVDRIRSIIPGVAISTDIIAGFCDEREEDHNDTLSLMEQVKYDMAFMFAYSMRKKTHAYHRLKDSVPEDIKKKRLAEIISTFYSLSGSRNKRFIGTEQLVLLVSATKRNEMDCKGKSDTNHTVIFPRKHLPGEADNEEREPNTGEYVRVKITDSTSLSLKGVAISRTTLTAFNQQNDCPSYTN
ncbi:PREDICTED: CDK5 regulatory subunit-associated protein 1-like [Amphimedon queenslandica]|uniref:TRAM domain-containing protein n=1 Tax=Amphimedon queenslandica TaxID=400682 RepID=A0A1X7VKF2_AMPQE|nr:PREDICTED: CDK5 regulatory subunit-associated protein 1-like [Amphimedon queenslandica]|eukprot:XP_003384079.1 PREDICTED: CDK5 regulatory subunit-associated protein 1-like [Amphimedon queenslandica]